MLDQGNFIASKGINQIDMIPLISEHRMSRDSKISDLRINGGSLRKININAGGFYLNSFNILAEDFYLIFSGATTIKIDGENHKILLLPSQYLILSEVEETQYRFFINYTERTEDIFFIKLNKAKFKVFAEAMELNNQLPITHEAMNILFSLFDCDYDATLKTNFLQAKVIELLCCVEHQVKNHNNSYKTSEVPAHMLEPIQLAREIMISNLKEPLSLVNLARRAGTNENYLKKYFKIVFGQTVFGFLNEYKMQLAKKMLLKEKLPVNQVAADLGFKNSSNFSANFFKYYGFLPKKMKAGKLYMILFIEDFLMIFEEIGMIIGI